MCSRSVLGRQIALVKLLADNVLPGILVKARNGMNRRTFAQRASAAALRRGTLGPISELVGSLDETRALEDADSRSDH